MRAKSGQRLDSFLHGFAVTQLTWKNISKNLWITDLPLRWNKHWMISPKENNNLFRISLRIFIWVKKVCKLKSLKKDKKINADEARRIKLFPNQEDSGFELRVGRFGPYVVKEKRQRRRRSFAPAFLKMYLLPI
jgi:hypothetical protein